MKRSIIRPNSNRYSENYKPDSEYIAENLSKTQEYSKYLTDNLDKMVEYDEAKHIVDNLDNYQSYSEYIAEQISKTEGEREYEKSIGVEALLKEGFNKRYHSRNYPIQNRRVCKIVSKGNNYVMLDNDSNKSHWISKTDTLIDDDNYVYEILKYDLSGYNLYLRLDGHLKLKEGDNLYVNFKNE